MEYRCEATSVAGFLQRLAVSCVGNGYYRYVLGSVPERKDPKTIDAKMMLKFGVVDKSARHRRKAQGLANVLYVRYRHVFVLLVSDYGTHDAFESEGRVIRDVRTVPIKALGHSITYKGGHVHVRIEQELYLKLKRFLVENALRRSRAEIEDALSKLAFEAFAPVRSQLFCILRAINRRRKTAGLDSISSTSLRLYRIYPTLPVALPTPEASGTKRASNIAPLVTGVSEQRKAMCDLQAIDLTSGNIPIEAAYI
jgi:hypothetical protein